VPGKGPVDPHLPYPRLGSPVKVAAATHRVAVWVVDNNVASCVWGDHDRHRCNGCGLVMQDGSMAFRDMSIALSDRTESQ
jgi:hypothetical protein